MDITLIQSAIYGLKSANDIANKVIELQSILVNAQSCALAAQSQQSALIEEIRALKEKAVSSKAWKRQQQRYQLIAPWKDGVITYAHKESMSKGEPPHWICTTCYENGTRMILNPVTDSQGRVLLNCPGCHTHITTGFKNTPPIPDYV